MKDWTIYFVTFYGAVFVHNATGETLESVEEYCVEHLTYANSTGHRGDRIIRCTIQVKNRPSGQTTTDGGRTWTDCFPAFKAAK